VSDLANQRNEEALADYLIGVVLDASSGASTQECVGNLPHDTYFLGNLRNEDPHNPGASRISAELLGKLSPTACGLEIKVSAGDVAELQVEAHWALYYRVVPERAEQLRYQMGVDAEAAISTDAQPGELEDSSQVVLIDEDGENHLDSPEPPIPPIAGRRAPSETLLPKWRKIPCSAVASVRLVLTGSTWTSDTAGLEQAIRDELVRASKIALGDPQRLRAQRNPAEPVAVPVDAAASDSSYRQFVAGLHVDLTPRWEINLDVSVVRWRTDTGEIDIRLELANVTPGVYTSKGKPSPNVEPYLFDVGLVVASLKGEPRPFELLLAPRGFRSDRCLWARGHNVGVVIDAAKKSYSTVLAPTYRQPRYVTKTMDEAEFARLASDPLPALQRIEEQMISYLEVWEAALAEHRLRPEWSEDFEREFEADRQIYRDEIRRFSDGRRLVTSDDDVRLAFQLTNETFSRGRNRSWRLFQLVFLVSQIAAIASLKTGEFSDERRKVDIIYYPTGGGKTEAYLGTLVFHAFFDRLRGKPAGVTGWIRFPLRLLTLQQTQRLADVLSLAELIRRAHPDQRLSGPGVMGFSVGYFVGDEGSPNEIVDPATVSDREAGKHGPHWATANDSAARQIWKRVAWCPSCRTRTITVDFDPKKVRLFHRCTNQDCAFTKGILPVFVTDNEIYRYLPTVLVGTIDKLASIGNQRKLAMVFGRVQGRCVDHGYYFSRCTQKGCKVTPLGIGGVAGISGPTLLVQDELHLLREGLGTFDSHYETFAQELTRRFGNPELKLVASSATIEAFERQVEHLYGRPGEGRVFPGPGPRLGESFYAETIDVPQRIYVGVLPHNKTLLNSILELLELLIAATNALRTQSAGPSPFGGPIVPGTKEWDELLDLYATSLTYFLAKRDLDAASNDISADVSPNLQARGFPAVTQFHMTSETRTDEVGTALEHLQAVGSATTTDAVLATNMVSHGVDVDRFNAMLFHGMPRQTSEYIQASSRIGRSHCGICFVVMHPARERDQSHYEYFAKYHEFLGQLVEPVAINRHAAFAMDRTIPGLFMGELLQFVATSGTENPGKFYQLDFIKTKISRGEITANTMSPMLEAAYGPGTSAEVQERVNRLVDQIVQAAGLSMVSEALIPQPLMSLREVDESVDIELDSDATSWSSRG
jgi:hypothetical protein